MVQKKPQPEDKLFSILYYGQFGRAFWFYFLSPSRVDYVLVSSSEFEQLGYRS